MCHHVRSTKTICGVVHGEDGADHSINCKVGGGVDKRHNDVRDAVHEWLVSIGIKGAKIEQEIPKWHKPEEKARLDIAYTDTRLGEVCVDVSLVNSVVSGAARRAMTALERREKMKHARYPGAGLFAFVLDVRGRWGKEAHAFVQSVAGTLDKRLRAEAIRSCRRRVSRALQIATAEQVMSAAVRPAVPITYGRRQD